MSTDKLLWIIISRKQLNNASIVPRWYALLLGNWLRMQVSALSDNEQRTAHVAYSIVNEIQTVKREVDYSRPNCSAWAMH